MAFVRYGISEKILDVIRTDECKDIKCPYCSASLGRMIRNASKDELGEAEFTCNSCKKTFKLNDKS